MSQGTPPPDSPSGDDSGRTPPPPPPPSQPPPGGDQPGWGSPPPPPGEGGGYGAAPPPPPPGAGGPAAYSPTDAIAYGFNAFKANAAPLVIGTLLLIAVAGLLSIVTNAIATGIFTSELTTTVNPDGTLDIEGGRGFFAGLLISMVVSLFVGLVAQLFVAGLIKGSLDIADGKPVSVGSMFEGWDKTKVLIAALLVSVATAIGTLLCYFPGLIVGFLLSYTLFFVVDRQMEPVEAMKASFSFITGNLGPTLLYYVLAVLVVIAGAILCGVGLLVAVPIAVGGAAYTFRKLHGQQVATV